jgi:hypothetical protein
MRLHDCIIYGETSKFPRAAVLQVPADDERPDKRYRDRERGQEREGGAAVISIPLIARLAGLLR